MRAGSIIRARQLLWKPRKQTSQGISSPGAQLLVQSGLVRQSGPGLFDFLPLGFRIVSRLSERVDHAMQQIGGSRISLPLLTPAELWKQTGRLQGAGAGVFRVRDRKDTELILAPTHEEAATSLAASLLNEGVPAPMRLYQIGAKFRDEARPRGGLLRGREFLMKDMYTFDITRDAALATYREIATAYNNLFESLGVKVVQAIADAGDIGKGGALTHEFHIVSDVGDDELILCEPCGYAANTEAATCIPPSVSAAEAITELQNVRMSDAGWMQRVASLRCSQLFYARHNNDTKLIVAVVPMGRIANPHLLRGVVPCVSIDAVPTDERSAALDSVSPENATIVLDRSIAVSAPSHLRSCPRGHIVQAVPGDMCAGSHTNISTSAVLRSVRGIEVGHLFLLGTQYSEPLRALVHHEGKRVPAEMGCYGLGVSRLIAAVAETHYDSDGLVWPAALSPVDAVVVGHGAATDITLALCEQLTQAGLDVMMDDRDASIGARVRDAYTLGVPFTVVAGKDREAGMVELHTRAVRKQESVAVSELTQAIAAAKQ